jgi:hypothetical protein
MLSSGVDALAPTATVAIAPTVIAVPKPITLPRTLASRAIESVGVSFFSI